MKTAIETEHLRIFAAIVAEGSFTRAAQLLQTNKAHVSRVVARLEEHLDLRLLQRSTRALALTEAGRELHGRARAILAALDDAEAALRHHTGTPSGLLRLTCCTEFGLFQVNRWIAEYLRLYPDVSVTADFNDRVSDILHEGFDLAIRMGDLPHAGLSARKLGEVTYALYASPGYLAGRGVPNTPDALETHELLARPRPDDPLATLTCNGATARISRPARYVANTDAALRDMAAEGIGIALLPVFLAAPLERTGRLQPLLPGWTCPPTPVHAVFASQHYLTPNLRAFVDLACAGFAS